MTEHEIKTIKKLLANSHTPSNSQELDQRIIEHANSTASVKSENQNKIFGIGFLSPAILAIVLTLGLFFWMGQIVSVDQIAAQKQAAVDALNFEQRNADIEPAENYQPIDRPEKIAVLPKPEQTQSARDAILFEYDLPSTDVLLANMDLATEFDSQEVGQSIELALTDIKGMISQRQFNEARMRYALLRQNCRECSLPNTLEDLVLADSSFTKPG